MLKFSSVSKLSVLATAALFMCAWPDIGGGLKELGTGALEQAGISKSKVDTAISVTKTLSTVRTSLTEEEEYFLGRGVAAMVFGKYRALHNDTVNNYVSTVGQIVAGSSSRPETFAGYHFQVLDSDEVNAFAAPGGFIFITKGLLKLIPDEDGLAAVLAHEVAHIISGHGVKAITQAKLTDAFLLIGKQAASDYTPAQLQALTGAFEDSVSDVFETMITKGYSRSQEYESDLAAVTLAKKAGYSPNGLAQTLTALGKVQGSAGWYSTHPAPGERKAEIAGVSKANVAADEAQTFRAERFKLAIQSLS